MKHSIWLFALMLVTNLLPAFSQNLTVESFEVASSDLSASTHERLDFNDKPCALVKVQLAASGATFDGNFIGDVAYQSGEYWVYMPEGNKRLTVKHDSFLPLDVNFEEFGVSNTQSKYTYVLRLQIPQGVRVQREADVHGQYKLTISEHDNITLKDARLQCLELAKAAAIKAEFGEMVTSDVFGLDKETDQENALAKAQGNWLGDTKQPQLSVEYIDGKLIFTADVWGKAREVIQAKTDLEWKILKGEDGQDESAAFDSGQRIRIQFKSPSEGYVAIYLIEEGDETSCLLPYPQQDGQAIHVEAGTTYTFFDRQTDPNALKYALNTGHEIEKNQLVIIYSPNPFTKCNDKGGVPGRPNILSSHYFQRWLLRCQRADKDMVVNKKWVTVYKKKKNSL